MDRDNREEEEEKPLGRCSVFTYGVGHMLNDITQCCWYTYLLLYLTDIGLSPSSAAIVTLVGQFADAFTTIIAGELIDRFGHFKIWHGAGCIMVASLMLYAVTFFVFTNNAEDIKAQYRWMAFISIFIGGVFVIIFHLGIKEPRKKDDGHEKNGSNTPWTYWLKKVLYYQVASIYVFTRVVTNVSQTFLAVYVINDLRMNQSAKSLVPAIIYLCSFITSVLLQELEWSGKRLKIFFAGGGILWLLCGGAVMLLPINMNAFMYALSVFIGIANALMMVTSIGMESALVDKHLDGSAFVYGSMGFIDKVLCGVALYFLESFEDADPVPCNPAHACFSVTRFSLGFIPGIAALLGVIVSFTMKQLQTSHKKPLAEPLLA